MVLFEVLLYTYLYIHLFVCMYFTSFSFHFWNDWRPIVPKDALQNFLKLLTMYSYIPVYETYALWV